MNTCSSKPSLLLKGLNTSFQVHHSAVKPLAPVMADPAWWKLTFLRKKKSEPKVLYEIPPDYSANNGNKELGSDATDSNLDARLEKIVDKSATKGRHVKVSHSGRFKEKKKIRATLAENPGLFPEPARTDKNHVVEN